MYERAEVPWARSAGVDHLSMTSKKMGMLSLPAVLLRRVTAVSTFHGQSETCSTPVSLSAMPVMHVFHSYGQGGPCIRIGLA